MLTDRARHHSFARRATAAVVLTAACALAAGCNQPPGNSGEQLPAGRPRTMTREQFAFEAVQRTRRKARIKGWVDSQPLAVWARDTIRRTGAAASIVPGLRYGPGAKIVPVDYLERLNDAAFDQWQTVAYVYIEGAYPKLGIPEPQHAGDPVAVEIRRTSNDPVSGWEAHVVYPPTQYVSRVMRVRREVHTAADGPIPGSARWIFTKDDEAGWIECGMGCCTWGLQATQ